MNCHQLYDPRSSTCTCLLWDAGRLYDSITTRLFPLPDTTLVYPGHDYSGRSCSSIGDEKAYNPLIGNGVSRAGFIEAMGNRRPDSPQRIHEVLPSNPRCGVPAH